MFKGGGFAHRGTGITSGLDTPKRGYVDGPGSYAGIEDIKSDAEEYYDLLKGYTPERKPFSRLAAASPALLNLSGALLSGKSYQGGFGGALDILGQGLTASAPGFAQAVEARRKYEAADPEADLRMKALGLAIENQPDPEAEKFTGKESFKARVKVAPVEEGGKPDYVVRDLTRFVSNYGNVHYKDQYNNEITDFTPMEKADTFQGPDGYQYEMKNIEGENKAFKIPGQEGPIVDPDVKTFQGKDGYEYLIKVDPDDPTKVSAVLLPGQETVENDPTLFKGPNGYTYLLNANNEAELVPGQGAPDKAIKTFKGADGLTYMLDEETKTAVVIPGQAEPKEKLEMFEGPNGIQYKVIDGKAEIIPGQEDQKPAAPKTGLFFNEAFKSESNPKGIVPAQFEYDEVKDRWRWTYEAPDGTIKNMPAEGSIQLNITSETGTFESTVNSVKSNLLTSEIGTRQAIASIDNAIEFVLKNPGANTIIGDVAAFTNDVKAEINQVLRVIGKGKIETTDVLNLNSYNEAIPGTEFGGWESLGIRTNEMKSKLLDLAYIVAAARGQTGRALSDKDVARFIQILGTNRADYKSVVATLNSVKQTLANEYAIAHNTFATQYKGIDSVPDDFLLQPIGEYRDDEGGLVNPFDPKNEFSDLASEVDEELKQ